MSSNITPGPNAPYNNPPIMPQYYQPSVFTVVGIVLGASTLVTTSVNHNYVIGQLCRLLIPSAYGTVQLDEQEGIVNSIPAANQVVLNINSTGFNLFNPSPVQGPTPPQIVAVGDYNSGIINAQGRSNPTTNIPGSFINISPQ